MSNEQRKADYLAGFMASGNTWNSDTLNDLENHPGWLKERDKVLFEIGLTGEELQKKYAIEHPRHTLGDWQEAVRMGDTIRGHWDWVAAQLEESPS